MGEGKKLDLVEALLESSFSEAKFENSYIIFVVTVLLCGTNWEGARKYTLPILYIRWFQEYT